MVCIIFQGPMFCNVANKIKEFEFKFKFVDVSVAEMCLQDHCKTRVLSA